MSSFRYRASSGLSRNCDGRKGASPSTQSTDAADEDDTFSVGTDPAAHNSIALSIQDTECSFSSEYTEDTFGFPNILETFKAEMTGDYSHFERSTSKECARDDAESVYTEFPPQHLEESSDGSSFPRDDASPTIHVVAIPAAKTRHSESPSREMNRLIYSASKSKAPTTPKDLSYSRSPPAPPQSLSFKSRTAPAQSSFVSSSHASSFNSSRRASSRSFSRDWDSNKENTRYDDDVARQELTNSSSRMKGPDLPDEPLMQTSPSIIRREPIIIIAPDSKPDFSTEVVTPSRSATSGCNEVNALSPQERGRGFGGVPFDEIDFFDWDCLQVKPKEQSQYDSPLLDEPQSPFDESPKKTPLPSIDLSSAENSTTRSGLTVAERVEARLSREATKTPSPDVNPTLFTERSPLGSTPSTSLLSKFDSVDTSGIDSSSRRNGLTRSTSYRDKRDLLSQRTSKMDRSESFTFGSKRADLSRASLDAADPFSPTILSFEKNDTRNQETYTNTPKKSMFSTREDSSSEELDTTFPFSKPNTPTLTSEEIEVALSDPNFSFESSGGLSRSQSWKEKGSGPPSRPSLMKKSVSFTLGSKRSRREKEQHLELTPTKTLPSIFETTPADTNHQASSVLLPNSNKSRPSSRMEPPKSRGLTRSQSWRPKIGRLSRPSLTKRSESFKHYGKVGELQSDSLLASSATPPSADEIEVALRTPATHHNRGGRKKKTQATESQGIKSSPVTVLDFPTSMEFTPKISTESKDHNNTSTPEVNGLGKTLGKTICRVGNHVSCRSTAHESFDRCDNTPSEETVTPSLDKRIVSAEVPQKCEGRKELVECKSPIVKTKPEASQNSVASSRTMDTTFENRLDDLLEKVGLGSLALPAPPSPTDEQENEASSTIIDAVINFHI